jgi:hypothetical protein
VKPADGDAQAVGRQHRVHHGRHDVDRVDGARQGHRPREVRLRHHVPRHAAGDDPALDDRARSLTGLELDAARKMPGIAPWSR